MSKLKIELASLSDDRLAQLASNVILPEHAKAVSIKRRLLETFRSQSDWRRTLTQFILTVTSLQGAGYFLADLLINEYDYPFLKKSPLRLSKDGADATMRILEGLPRPMVECILNEAKGIYARRN